MESWQLIVGSPRPNGISARLARFMELRIADERPDVSLRRFDVADHLRLVGCNGCDYCDDGQYVCIHDDEADELLAVLAQADRALVVTPVYFTGVPSQFKALLDRFQPLFWKRKDVLAAGEPLPPKRPLYLYVVGEGTDPHGHVPLTTTIRAAFALADYEVVFEQDFIGKRHLNGRDISLPEGGMR